MKQLSKTTVHTKADEIKRNWHQVDVKGQVLGRVATKIAVQLMGKQKPYFVKNLDCGDYVVVTNAAEVKVTGGKATGKMYTSYSGYPGGLREEAFKDLIQRSPETVIMRAVSGMLPKNKLRDQMLKRLYVYKDNNHPYKNKIQNAKS